MVVLKALVSGPTDWAGNTNGPRTDWAGNTNGPRTNGPSPMISSFALRKQRPTSRAALALHPLDQAAWRSKAASRHQADDGRSWFLPPAAIDGHSLPSRPELRMAERGFLPSTLPEPHADGRHAVRQCFSPQRNGCATERTARPGGSLPSPREANSFAPPHKVRPPSAFAGPALSPRAGSPRAVPGDDEPSSPGTKKLISDPICLELPLPSCPTSKPLPRVRTPSLAQRSACGGANGATAREARVAARQAETRPVSAGHAAVWSAGFEHSLLPRHSARASAERAAQAPPAAQLGPDYTDFVEKLGLNGACGATSTSK